MPIRRVRRIRKVLKSKPKKVVQVAKKAITKPVTVIKKKKHRIEEDDKTEYPELSESVGSDISSDESIEEYSEKKIKNDVTNQKVNEMIRTRYNELLQELWENENTINEMEIRPELRNLLNRRSRLWLEYFISTYTFNNYQNLDVFNYMDTFNNSTKYL